MWTAHRRRAAVSLTAEGTDRPRQTGLGLWTGSGLEASSPFNRPSSHPKQDLLLGLTSELPRSWQLSVSQPPAASQNHPGSFKNYKCLPYSSPPSPPRSNSMCNLSCTHRRSCSRGEDEWQRRGIPFLAAEPSGTFPLSLDSPSPGSCWLLIIPGTQNEANMSSLA